MGRRGSGTGQPHFFHCTVERRERNYWYPRAEHKVVRTGRERGEHRDVPGWGLSYQVEYRCSCGHVGWTKHRDILRKPLGCSEEADR